MRTRRNQDTSPEMETGIGVQTEPVEKNDMTEVYENLKSIPTLLGSMALRLRGKHHNCKVSKWPLLMIF